MAAVADLSMTDLERAYWLALSEAPELRSKLSAWIPRFFSSARILWNASTSVLKNASGLSQTDVAAIEEARRSTSPGKAMRKLEEAGGVGLLKSDPEYPPLLRTLGDAAPSVLYVKGPMNEPAEKRREAAAAILRSRSVAIVGSRSASAYGENVAGDFGYGLASSGVTIISGLAVGIDAAAHWGCLDAGGSTVAVIGSGIDVVYPKQNRTLTGRIAEAGVILSEYPPGTRPFARHFPARNRIISALSSAVVIVEGGYESGAMITARCALDQGRPVMAVPGSIYSPHSKGPHSLIADGAPVASSSAGIMAEAGLTAEGAGSSGSGRDDDERLAAELSPLDLGLLKKIPWVPISSQEILMRSGYEPQEVSAGLLRLEIAGIIAKDHGNTYFRLR